MRDTGKIANFYPFIPTMKSRLDGLSRKPRVGVTQGGSSAKNSGCKVAATKRSFTKPRGHHGP